MDKAYYVTYRSIVEIFKFVFSQILFNLDKGNVSKLRHVRTFQSPVSQIVFFNHWRAKSFQVTKIDQLSCVRKFSSEVLFSDFCTNSYKNGVHHHGHQIFHRMWGRVFYETQKSFFVISATVVWYDA